MIDWLLVARSNNYGLTRDAQILAEAIEAADGTSAFAETRQRSVIDRLMRRKRAKQSFISSAYSPAGFPQRTKTG